jgi:PAS domain S-box-containing protein
MTNLTELPTLSPPDFDEAVLRADLWASLYHGNSSNQVMAAWAAMLHRSFGAEEVGIWTIACDSEDPVLDAYASRPERKDDPFTQRAAVRMAVQHVCARHPTSSIVGVGKPGHSSGPFTIAAETDGETIFACPMKLDGRISGLFALRLTEARAFSTVSLARMADELAAALAFLRRQERQCQAQSQYEALFFRTPVIICCLDSDCNLTRWNPSAEKIFGWHAREVLGRPLPFARLSDRDLLDTCCRGALAGQPTRKIEMNCVTRAGTPLRIALSAVPLFAETGAIEGALIVAVDISGQKRAEDRIQLQTGISQTLARANSLEEAVHSILTLLGTSNKWDCGEFWTAEPEGRLLNRTASLRPSSATAEQFDAAIRSRGGSEVDDLPRRVLSTSALAWFPRFSSDRGIDRAALAAQCGLNDAIGFRVVNGNVTFGVFLFCAEKIEPPDDEFVLFLQTIGEQIGKFARQEQVAASLRSAEAKILQLQKLETMGCLVGGFVHDFNNLMTIILGYGDLVLDSTINASLAREAHLEIFDAAKHASVLTRRLLAFSRKESLNPVVLNINSIIERLQPMIRRLIGKDTELHLDLAPVIRNVSADPGQIDQLVMNLVVNARDAMRSFGRLTIRTKDIEVDKSQLQDIPGASPGRYVMLTVNDTGCGMDDGVKQHIFDPFFTTKPAGEGTGIGLSTVLDIVKRCGGHVAVQSEPGHGTTFKLLFPPAVNGLASWTVDSSPTPVMTGTETLLVVDDESCVRRLIGLVLRARGYAVIESASPSQAIALCQKHAGPIDLLIMDLSMPGIIGVELVERLFEVRPNLKVLPISADSNSEPRSEGLRVQSGPLLHKPFTSQELATRVREVLDGEK